jgi:hypothetical protein
MELEKLNDLKRIAFWIEHNYQYYYATNEIQKCAKTGCEIILFVSNKINPYVINLPSNVKIFFIEDLKSKKGEWIDYIFKAYFIPINFSKTYYRKIANYKKFTPQILFCFKLLNKIFSLKRNFNKKYVQLISFMVKINFINKLPIKFDFLHVYTKVNYSYLIAAYSHKIISHMESWDHFFKTPYFFNSILHYTWNNTFKEDIRIIQDNIGEIRTETIEKFNYTRMNILEDVSPFYKKEIDWFKKNKNNYIIYPICLSSRYHEIQPSEIVFINYLIEILNETGLKIYIRPYPLAPISDLKEIIENGHVKIGVMKEYFNGSEVFDKSFLQHKIELIKNAKKVINVGTTFVFDSAFLNTPITQLNLGKSFDVFSEVSAYPHIDKYLNIGLNKIETNDSNFIRDQILNMDMSYLSYLKSFLEIK